MNIFTFFNKKIKQCHSLKYHRLHVSFFPFIITLPKLPLEVDMKSHHVNYACARVRGRDQIKRDTKIYQ